MEIYLEYCSVRGRKGMNIVVGKHTLESLTAGMYLSSMVLYREYIQNAIDSIDDAVEKGLLSHNEGQVIVEIDQPGRCIQIEDNGMGVSQATALETLLDIGNSNKSLSARRGFRGIGRLSGIACSGKITFQMTYPGEAIGTNISLDCTHLREIMIPGHYEDYDLVKAIESTTSSTSFNVAVDAHYFRVILEDVTDSDNILNRDHVANYLSQIAPLPYNRACFSWGKTIEEHLIQAGYPLQSYQILMHSQSRQSEQLFKLYSDEFMVNVSRNQIDSMKNIIFNNIYHEDGTLLAVLWYGQSKYLGTIIDDKIKGLRFRKDNMLVGTRSTLNSIFKEERFNGWLQGEVFVFDKQLIPNARRDDFEATSIYKQLSKQLSILGTSLSKEIRAISNNRNLEPNSFKKLSLITNKSGRNLPTKYTILNLATSLSIKEKLLLEKVFDVITKTCEKNQSEIIIKNILLECKPKPF